MDFFFFIRGNVSKSQAQIQSSLAFILEGESAHARQDKSQLHLLHAINPPKPSGWFVQRPTTCQLWLSVGHIPITPNRNGQ